MDKYTFKRRVFALQAFFFVGFGVFLGLLGITINPIMAFFSLFFFVAGASIWKGVSMSGSDSGEWDEPDSDWNKESFGTTHSRFHSTDSSGFSDESTDIDEPYFHEKYIEYSYDVLDLDSSASMDEVQNAYRDKVKDVHPDVSEAESNDEFHEVQTAYETIKEVNDD